MPRRTTPRRTPILSLTTTTARLTVKIDGKPYALVAPESLRAIDYPRFGRMALKVDALLQLEAPSEAESKELSQVLDRMVRMVLTAPTAVHVKLTDLARLSIVNAFSEQLQTAAPQVVESLKASAS